MRASAMKTVSPRAAARQESTAASAAARAPVPSRRCSGRAGRAGRGGPRGRRAPRRSWSARRARLPGDRVSSICTALLRDPTDPRRAEPAAVAKPLSARPRTIAIGEVDPVGEVRVTPPPQLEQRPVRGTARFSSCKRTKARAAAGRFCAISRPNRPPRAPATARARAEPATPAASRRRPRAGRAGATPVVQPVEAEAPAEPRQHPSRHPVDQIERQEAEPGDHKYSSQRVPQNQRPMSPITNSAPAH